MKKLIIAMGLSIAAIIWLESSCSAQTIVKDSSGNYVTAKATKQAATDEALGKTFTDSKGNKWPVYRTATGRIYALRTSKSGKSYRQYLETPKQ